MMRWTRWVVPVAWCWSTILAASALATAQSAPSAPPSGASSSVAVSAAPSSAPLPAQIAEFLAPPTVARDHWGIIVTALDGTPLYSLNEAQLFQPASNAKLFTTAAAVALLGPDKTFDTTISGAFDRRSGRVTGDLVLHGGGDANFDSGDLPYIAPANRPKGATPAPRALHDLDDLVSQLVVKGVKEVDGDIVGDDTLFPWEPYPSDWTIDDAIWGYGAPVSALTISDNQLRLTATSAISDHLSRDIAITLDQHDVPYYSVQAEVERGPAKSDTNIQVDRDADSRTLRVYGQIADGGPPDVEEISIDDPAEYAAMALKLALESHGIAVRGIARAKHRPAQQTEGFLELSRAPSTCAELRSCIVDCYSEGFLSPSMSVLATHRSAPLAQDLMFTNKVSQNLHAELMLHHLPESEHCLERSTAEGARMVRRFLTLHAGIAPDDFIFFDGSGLSGHDLVTPRATAKLLQYATTQPWGAAWKSSLPVGGEDGTLASRFSKPPIKDHLFAKTGTLGEARALSGYLDCASGRTVIFSIMVGNHLPADTSDREAMDKIVAAIWAAE